MPHPQRALRVLLGRVDAERDDHGVGGLAFILDQLEATQVVRSDRR